jgi:pimeloyl-ACP methyl ester carboxylesterase
MLGQMGSGFDPVAVDEYWKAYASAERRRGMLELFRSGDLEKLEPYAGRLGQLGVPTLVLWGENDDEYAPWSGPTGSGVRSPVRGRSSSRAPVTSCGRTTPERCAREVIAFLDASG